MQIRHSFEFWNKTAGFGLFFISILVYTLTLEPSTSLWDCAEYITSSYLLQIGHPPGAPIFAMLARLFAVCGEFFGLSPAFSINLMNAIFASLGVFWVYHSTVLLAKKIALQCCTILDTNKTIAIIGSGVVSASSLIFLDTYWFNATEAEVYALSTTLVMGVFWATLKWDELIKTDKDLAYRYLLFAFFIIGLSACVRMLSLLALTAMGYVYYFGTRENITPKGIIGTGFLGILATGLFQYLIIPGLPKASDFWERFAVNKLGLPFHTGVLLFLVVATAILAWILQYAHKKQKHELSFGAYAFVLMMLGYLSYALLVIRAAENPPMNQNKPDTMSGLRGYVLRERYGNTPFLYGPYFNAPLLYTNTRYGLDPAQTDGFPLYIKVYKIDHKGEEKTFDQWQNALTFAKENGYTEKEIKGAYIVENYDEITKNFRNRSFVYHPHWQTIFPRLWSSSGKHASGYTRWSGYEAVSTEKLKEYKTKALRSGNPDVYKRFVNQQIQEGTVLAITDDQGNVLYENAQLKIPAVQPRPPKMSENLRFYFSYQLGFMYFRYFMWNFAGKQMNQQGLNEDLYRGQWISGIKAIDAQRLGSQDNLPSFIKDNKGHNIYFYLPLLFGLLGMIYHFKRAPKDAFVVLLLFLLIGVALSTFLNIVPEEPRERDYVFGASFFPFTIWIGLAVYALYDSIKSLAWKDLLRFVSIGLGFIVLSLIFELFAGQGYALSLSLIYLGTLGALLLAGIKLLGSWHLLMASVVAFLLALSVPVVLAWQNWDDHDRSNRYFARQMGRAYLDACLPQSILFTQGDNDTFPLWYNQDVENYRTDVRVMNMSLLHAEWHINQLRQKNHESEPFVLQLSEEKYRPSLRGYVSIEPDEHPLTEKYKDARLHAKEALKFIASDKLMQENGYGFSDAILPTRKVFIKVNKENAVKSGIVKAEDAHLMDSVIQWDLKGNVLYKAHLAILDLLAGYEWDRPIYFTGTHDLGNHEELSKYMVQEGMNYKFTPIANAMPDTARIKDLLLNQYTWGIENPKTYIDNYTLRNLLFVRILYLNSADVFVSQGDLKTAEQILDKALSILDRVEWYSGAGEGFIIPYAKKYRELGDMEQADVLYSKALTIYGENLTYFSGLDLRFLGRGFAEIYEALSQLKVAFSGLSLPLQKENTARIKLLYQQSYKNLLLHAMKIQKDYKLSQQYALELYYLSGYGEEDTEGLIQQMEQDYQELFEEKLVEQI